MENVVNVSIVDTDFNIVCEHSGYVIDTYAENCRKIAEELDLSFDEEYYVNHLWVENCSWTFGDAAYTIVDADEFFDCMETSLYDACDGITEEQVNEIANIVRNEINVKYVIMEG